MPDLASKPPRLKPRSKSKALLARLAEVESPDVTFLGDRFPIVMEKGRGLVVTDADGNRYLDFTACFGVLALGHRPEAITQALRKQAAKLVHGMGDVHPTGSKVRLLELLARITPFQKANAVLSLAGGEAVESALKTSLLATGRKRFVSFQGGYHGLHMGPLTLNDRQAFTRGFEGWIGERNVQIPFPYECENAGLPPSAGRLHFGAPVRTPERAAWLASTHGLRPVEEVLTQLEDTLKSREFAALVLEPLQGRGGERTWPAGFVKEACALAKRYGTLVVFDEIYSGFGRTGPLFALEHHGVVPDLLCLGKALGGGLPLSACVGEASLFGVWGKTSGEARHTSTFLGHPLACATGLAAVNGIVRRLPEFQTRMKTTHDAFVAFVRACENAGLPEWMHFEVRGEGYMKGLWFHSAPDGFGAQLMSALLEEAFITLPSGPRGDVLSFTPPLIATEAHHAKVLAHTLKLLKTLARQV
ncbi:MAG: aspartate aminotransferase family protein [Silvanigrellales bacterium]|nr:aspartate aminotransferase family protein [Silvanigrellales bacterium]